MNIRGLRRSVVYQRYNNYIILWLFIVCMDNKQTKQIKQLEKQQKKLEEKTRKKQEAEDKKAANKTRKKQEAKLKKEIIKAEKEAAKTLKKQAAIDKKVSTKTRKRKITIIEGSPINIPFSVLPEKVSPLGVKRTEPRPDPLRTAVGSSRLQASLADPNGSLDGSIGGPDQKIFDFQERPPILHRPSGDAEKRFLDSTSRIFIAKLENPVSNIKPEPLEKKMNKKNIKILGEISKEEMLSMDSNSDIIIKKIQDFKTKGISVLDHVNEKTLTKMIEVANTYYYNETPLLNDNEFDIIKEYMERKHPQNQVLAKVGAPITITKNKVTLPYEMASMDKIKPDTGALAQWKQKYKGPYVLSCKLDGVSGMYVIKGTDKGTNGKSEAKLYTRGDGKVGQDITHLINAIQLPSMNHTDLNGLSDGIIAVRGEFIIPKKIFDEKYKATFANPRNLVSGIINSKTIDDKTRDLHFVTYEVVYPPMKPSEQMTKLTDLGHEVVMNRTVHDPSTLTNEMLSELLLDWRKNYEYEIDGVIVSDNNIYPRKSGNPDHAFAFKMVISDQMAEAKVVDVIWTPSKNGYLKPRVRIEPIKLGGVTIEYATGFNGKFIEDNKIGIGALIQLVRSGDVIPYIKSVSVPAETAKMPDVTYTWNDTHVDILLENSEDNETVREKNITGFFVHLEVEGLSSGNVKRIMKAGHTSVAQILKMSKEDFAKVEGFQTKTVDKIYNGIHAKVDAASLLDIMVASNKMGKGMAKKKLQPILDTFPDILTTVESPDKKIEMLMSIKGIGKENAAEFVESIPHFLTFLKECDLEVKRTEPLRGSIGGPFLKIEDFLIRPSILHRLKGDAEKRFLDSEKKESKLQDITVAGLENTVVNMSKNMDMDISHPLYHKKIVMTKIRDKEIINALVKYGATLEDTMKKDVFVLVVKSKDDTSSKMEFAKKNNIPIMTPDEFKTAYMQ